MSRGPGKWQRAILAELEGCEWFWLKKLLPQGYTRSDYHALLRAAHKLPKDKA